MPVFDTRAKVGDKVCIARRNRRDNSLYLVKGVIERVTATQIVAIQGRRFQKSTGREIGGFGNESLEPLTDELLAEDAKWKKIRIAWSVCQKASETLQRLRGEDILEFLNVAQAVVAKHEELMKERDEKNAVL